MLKRHSDKMGYVLYLNGTAYIINDKMHIKAY